MDRLGKVHLNGLRAVETVARLGSLQKAADELGVSPSAVSQLVNRAEKQIGRPVFERTRTGLVPTEFGRRFCERLTAAFRELSGAMALAEDAADNRLVVSVAPAFAARWLVPRLSRFYAAHPEIMLRIDASTKLADLDRSDIDLAIRMGDGDWPGVRAELLFAQRIFPVCAPVIAARLKRVEDLAHEWVIREENGMVDWARWFAQAGVEGVTPQHGRELHRSEPLPRGGDRRPGRDAGVAAARRRRARRRQAGRAVRRHRRQRARLLRRDLGGEEAEPQGDGVQALAGGGGGEDAAVRGEANFR